MAITNNWDATVPAGTDDPRDGDDVIRALKAAIYERLTEGTGLSWPDGTVATSGRPACGIQTANKFTIYETDLATVAMELDDSNNTATFGAAGVYDLVGQRYTTLAIPLPTNAAGKVSGIAIINRGGGTMEIREVMLTAFTPPSGGTCTLMPKIVENVTTTTNLLTKVTIDVLTAAISIADGNYHSSVISADGSFNQRTVPVGDALIFHIDPAAAGINGADDLMVTLLVRRTT